MKATSVKLTPVFLNFSMEKEYPSSPFETYFMFDCHRKGATLPLNSWVLPSSG